MYNAAKFNLCFKVKYGFNCTGFETCAGSIFFFFVNNSHFRFHENSTKVFSR